MRINSELHTHHDLSLILSMISNTLAMCPKQPEPIIMSDTVYDEGQHDEG